MLKTLCARRTVAAPFFAERPATHALTSVCATSQAYTSPHFGRMWTSSDDAFAASVAGFATC